MGPTLLCLSFVFLAQMCASRIKKTGSGGKFKMGKNENDKFYRFTGKIKVSIRYQNEIQVLNFALEALKVSKCRPKSQFSFVSF